MSCIISPFLPPTETIPKVLSDAGLPHILCESKSSNRNHILIKPNLVNQSPSPITTPVMLIRELVHFIRLHTSAPITIAEGAGEPSVSTDELFELHGYTQLANELSLDLVDLNTSPLVRLERDDCTIFPFFMMPEIVLNSLLISVPVLKAHSLSDVTLTMKNMIGCASPEYCQQGGYWRKSIFHNEVHQSILELNRYRTPDFSLIDASIGMAEYHLGGPHCEPPVGCLVAGDDPVAVDVAGASLLGFDWRKIPHIADADGELGNAEDGKLAYRLHIGSHSK